MSLILLIGNKGSGKSLTMAKTMHTRQERCYGNFRINLPKMKYHRLKLTDLLIKDEKGKYIDVNWDFWENAKKKYKGYHIIIDEVHNLVHSRRSMTNKNIYLSEWVSQVRKILGDNEQYDLIISSQTINKIDKDWRDLADEVICCTKIRNPKILINTKVWENGKIITKRLPITYIYLHYFLGENCVNNYLRFKLLREKRYNFRTMFIGNNYFQYYDSYELLSFGRDIQNGYA